MIQAEQITLDDKQRWNKLLMQSLYPSYRQSIEHENSKEINNRKVTSFIFTENDEDIAGIHYSIKHSRFLKTADILSGFVFKYEPTKDLLEYIIDHFIAFAKVNNAAYIRISPWLPQTIKGEETDYKSLFNKVFKEKKFDMLSEGRHTYWIDLTKSEEELLKNMKRQTRYRVRQGLKSNIQTNIYNEPDDNMIDKFWLQYQALASSKDFDMYSENKFKNELKSLLKSNLTYLFVFECQNTIINFSFASNFGISSYLHGAINYEFKKLNNCPSPGQLAQWKMINAAKNNGAKIYDMGFCPGPEPFKEHFSYNIWRFKYDFGGDHIKFLPTYGKSINLVKGKIFKFLKV